LTHNNRVDLAAEGLDDAIRFGDGAWHGTDAQPLLEPTLSPVCAPAIAHRLRTPAHLVHETLLPSYRADEWPRWFAAAGHAAPVLRGPIFDSSITMAAAAVQGAGVALLPPAMFGEELRSERLVQPFEFGVSLGRYWLTRLKSRAETTSMLCFRDWLVGQVALRGDRAGATPQSLPARPGRVAAPGERGIWCSRPRAGEPTAVSQSAPIQD
jgi:LysR family transcriptional regulator, regulator of gene expression of beta-lactamase